ncbi:DUF1499 domain-containing protein [Kiloniella antarctica]|uniref:DUF1499 domain-containing protein n=1 Tax=Kiloniella antarctica TaxID=1550907 RepID=A0ABW5BHR1_9PROT
MIAKLLLLLVVGIALYVAYIGRDRVLEIVFGPVVVEKIDFPSLVLGPKPNQFLVCPKGYCISPPDFVSPRFAQSATDLKNSWMAIIAAEPRIERGAVDDTALQYEFIQRTKWIGYPDSITVRFISLSETSSTLAIYSRSHYGKSDFGVNEQRIRAWLVALGT